jgi:hypothetical protein
MADETCACVKNHAPRPAYVQHHHVVPQSWLAQGAKPVEPEIVPLCGTAHDAVHDLLNHYVRAGGKPAWGVTRKYPRLIQKLAEQAWANRPNDSPPMTLAHPET